ncbi:VOC family protein [Nocardia harenae]|uniref:VOC family protein n=1 Tax=Nocardia harenae TaxID=358707 RepID=UPI00082DCE6D|nr:VOC family protein [Nocardia harenae]
MGAKQLKIGLRVRDLHRSAALYLRLGFREIPNDDQPELRYLTFRNTWLILSALESHGYNNTEREQLIRTAPRGLGVVLAIPVPDLDAAYELWQAEGLPITSDRESVVWARIFSGLDPDGYEVTFEQFE